MDERQVRSLEKLLLEKRERLSRDIKAMNSALSVGRDFNKNPEEFDYEAEITRGLLENEEKEVREIDAALARIKDKTFGICESCEKAIKVARLQMLPNARLCLSCKKKEEEA